MNPAYYALIGALGGVLITQVANYCLEKYRSENRLKEKQIDVQTARIKDLHNERKAAYSDLLAALDKYVTTNRLEHQVFLEQYYRALILAGEPTYNAIVQTYEVLKPEVLDTPKYLAAKNQLMSLMRSELSQ